MGLSWAYHDASVGAAEAEQLLRAAIDAGVDHFDTSDAYGFGENEKLVGRAIAASGRRDELVLATKAGLVGGEGEGSARYKYARNGRPEYIRAACDASLRRLGLETIDLYYLHRIDPETPIEETWSAMAGLVAAGKVRWLGISEAKVAELERIRQIHPVTAVQSELSLWTRDAIVGGVVAWCAANGASFVPFAPLGRGFLTGAISSAEFESDDFRAVNPRFTAEAVAQNLRIVDVVRNVAARHDVTPAQVAIAWTLAQGEHVLPIPGTRRRRHLEDNLAAAELRLHEADLDELNAVPATVGSRY